MATINGNGSSESLSGTSGDDTINGGGGSDAIQGLDGADLINGNDDGNDTIYGGVGNDTIYGGFGFDQLEGGTENDYLDGGGDTDNMLGGDGDDTMVATDGSYDDMTGGDGNDVYVVHSTNFAAREEIDGGTDELRTDSEYAYLDSNIENLTGMADTGQYLGDNDLDNLIRAGAGDDTISSSRGSDSLFGGSGSDLYQIVYFESGPSGPQAAPEAPPDPTITEKVDGGDDTVATNLAVFKLDDNVENLESYDDFKRKLAGAEAPQSAGDTSEVDHAFTGNGLDNVITGGDFDDTLDGLGGDDSLIGGDGNDVYHVDSAGDVVTEAEDEGHDTVQTRLSEYYLGDYVDDMVGTKGDQALHGNELANLISGWGGDDSIDGSSGADTFVGGKGNDVYEVEETDTVVEAQGEGIDEIRTSLRVFQNASNVEILTFNGSGRFSAVGNHGDERITGGFFADVLQGDEGADTLIGLNGDDVLEGDEGNDALDGGVGNDRVAGGAGSDKLTGGGGTDVFIFADYESVHPGPRPSGASPTIGVDLILDLQARDVIDLSGIDADTAAEDDQAFTLVENFTGHAGELRVRYNAANGMTVFRMDTDGDGLGDITVKASGEHTDFGNLVL